jgi:hypothetical protein
MNTDFFKERMNEYQTVSGNGQQSLSSQEITNLKILSSVTIIHLHAESYFVSSKTTVLQM